MNCGYAEDYSIHIIQGDNASFLFNITDEKNNVIPNITSVIFSCSRLNLKKNLVNIGNGDYELNFSAEETKNFSPCTCTYDITIKIENVMVHTVVKNEVFYVHKKENPIV